MTDKKSPWTVLGEKVAGVLIEAVDAGVAEVKRKAAAPPPNVVPLRPVDQAAEIELLKAEIDRLEAQADNLRAEAARVRGLELVIDGLSAENRALNHRGWEAYDTLSPLDPDTAEARAILSAVLQPRGYTTA